jgi:3-hydroxybutyryl-CoA dehydratase
MMPTRTPAGGEHILCRATKRFSAVMRKKLVHWEIVNCQKWLKASVIALDSVGSYKTDCRWAKAKGFDRLICHGLLVGSMICEFGGQVGWLATGMNYKFIKPVYFDEIIICKVTVTKIEKSGKAEAEALFFDASGEKVCCCLLTGRLPQSHEQILLAQMTTEGDPTNKLS